MKNGAWKVGATSQEHLLEVACDLLRILVMSGGVDLDDVYGHARFGAVSVEHPKFYTEEELREIEYRRKREAAKKMFGKSRETIQHVRKKERS